LREDLQSRGQLLSGSQLQSVITATSVRVRDGKELVTEGPFAETHEQLGGYFLVEVKNLDEATAIAGRILDIILQRLGFRQRESVRSKFVRWWSGWRSRRRSLFVPRRTRRRVAPA
jgi:hypothetical protein